MSSDLGKILKQRRVMVPLTLKELAVASGVSASHLGRIERGERYPSGDDLLKIAKPLQFEEDELFTLAGYLSPQPPALPGAKTEDTAVNLDPFVASVLGQKPVNVQRVVLSILTLCETIAQITAPEKSGSDVSSRVAEETR